MKHGVVSHRGQSSHRALAGIFLRLDLKRVGALRAERRVPLEKILLNVVGERNPVSLLGLELSALIANGEVGRNERLHGVEFIASSSERV